MPGGSKWLQTFWNKAAAYKGELVSSETGLSYLACTHGWLRQEHCISRVVALFPVSVTEFRQMTFKLIRLLRRNLYADKNAAVVGAVITVMEQADIPVCSITVVTSFSYGGETFGLRLLHVIA